MALDILDELARLIEQERTSLLNEWREKVRALPAAKHLDTPTLNDHIPLLLVELASTLRSGTEAKIEETVEEGTPREHGTQRVKDGFDIEEVVAEYNILRGCIHDLAERNGLNMQGKSFHVLNKVLDGAIGAAVKSYATYQAEQVKHRREEYLAFVAHDLRTPLSAISLSSRVLELQITQESPETKQMLKSLHRNVKYLQALVNKVLEENTHLEAEHGVHLVCREFDLWPLVEALIHDLHPVAGTGTTRLVNNVPEDFVVYADASLVQRVFQNLIANAIDYTPRGEVVIGAQSQGDRGDATCFVRDNGRGIPADRVGAVFDKHETDPEKPGGLGLGLAIVKTFIEAHGGIVTVESEVNVGTTFRFTLPGPRG
ncbi:sensor histidine kinase [soil metagenome]